MEKLMDMPQAVAKLREDCGAKTTPSEYELGLYEKAGRFCGPLRFLPGIRLVAVCNSLSMYATDKGSDIDLFIVTTARRLWLVRLLVTAYFQVLGVRRHGNKVAERFCLSFFVSEEGMDFWPFALDRDPYLAAWLAHLKPIVDIQNTYQKLVDTNKSVLDGTLISGDPYRYCTVRESARAPRMERTERRFASPFFDRLESLVRSMLMPKTLKAKHALGDPYGIIVSDSVLKFHDNDMRKEWRKRILGE